MTSSDHSEAGSAVKVRTLRQFGNRLLAGIDKVWVLFTFYRKRPQSEHTVFALQGDVNSIRNIIRHQRWNTYT